MIEVDVAIVGDGPAAYGAARSAAADGLDALVVSASDDVGQYPVFLGPRSSKALQEFIRSSPVADWVHELGIDAPGMEGSFAIPAELCVVSHRDLRAWMCSEISSTGLRRVHGRAAIESCEEGILAVEETTSGTRLAIRARVIIWCAGAPPSTEGRITIPVTYRAGEKVHGGSSVSISLHPDDVTESGYPTMGWTISGRHGQCVGSAGRHETEPAEQPGTRLAANGRIADYWAHSSVTGRVLFTGAAAGLQNALTGEGIGMAVESGMIAAESAGNADRVGHRYTERLEERFGVSAPPGAATSRRARLVARSITSAAEHPTSVRSRLATMMLDLEASRFATPARGQLPEWPHHLADLRFEIRAEVARRVSSLWRSPAPLVIGPEGLPDLRLSDCFIAMIDPDAASRSDIVKTAAAMDLTLLALGLMASATTVLEDGGQSGSGRSRNWFQISSVVALDYCLAQAACLAAEAGPDIVEMQALWSEELMAIRYAVLEAAAEPRQIFDEVFEFPFRVAAARSWSPGDDLPDVTDISRILSRAFYGRELEAMLDGGRGRLGLLLSEAVALRLVDTELDDETHAFDTVDLEGEFDEAVSALERVTDTTRQLLHSLLRLCMEGDIEWASV